MYFITRPQVDSPAIDAGDNARVPTRITTDLDGKPRFTDHSGIDDTGAGDAPIVDIGAYEYQSREIQSPNLTINYSVGKPGSSFLITGSHYQAESQYELLVNGVSLGTIATDQEGAFTIVLTTLASASPGEYRVVVRPTNMLHGLEVAQETQLQYMLDHTAPLREKAPGRADYEFIVPGPIPQSEMVSIYLPNIVR
jgi:hypothetical protein